MGAIPLFRLAGIQVSVSLWYFVLLIYFGRNDLETGVIWAGCVTVSILAHEFGHAAVAKWFKLGPSIMLHGWGGLCSHDRADRDRDDALIIAAGPAAGLVLGGLIYAAWNYLPAARSVPPRAALVVEYLLYINIWWSLINLLPLWPLDGGQLYRLFLVRVFKRAATAERVTHITGVAIAAAGLLIGKLYYDSMFLAVLAALLGYQNIVRIGSSSASGPIRAKNEFGNKLLAEARAAQDAGDHREAARLCHQIRAHSNVSPKHLDTMWEVLAVSTVAMGELDEAESYIKRAPRTPAVIAADAQRIAGLGDTEAARALLAAERKHIPDELVERLEQLAGG